MTLFLVGSDLTKRVIDLEGQLKVVGAQYLELSQKHNNLCQALEHFLRPILFPPLKTPTGGAETWHSESITTLKPKPTNEIIPSDRRVSPSLSEGMISFVGLGLDNNVVMDSLSSSLHNHRVMDTPTNAVSTPNASSTQSNSWNRYRSNSIGSMTAASISSASHDDQRLTSWDNSCKCDGDSDCSDDDASVSSFTSAQSGDSINSFSSSISKKRDRCNVNEVASHLQEPRRRRKVKYRKYGSQGQGLPQSVPTIYDVLTILGDCRVQEAFNSTSPSSSIQRSGQLAPTDRRIRNENAVIVYGSDSSSVLPTCGTSSVEDTMPSKQLHGLEAMAVAVGLRSPQSKVEHI